MRGVLAARLLLVAALTLVLTALALAQRNRTADAIDLLSGLQSPDTSAAQGSSASSGSKAPQPPPHGRWRTPLQRSCAAGEPQLRSALLQRLGALRDSQATIAIDPSNYDERFSRDAFGHRLSTRPSLVVLHETVYGIGSAINTFMTPHPRDEDQVSYHALIGLDGAVVKVLDPLKRAFGSGNSAFNSEWVITNPDFSGSVNNFALHVSLETPLDGEDADSSHSGYTAAQYDALAVLLADWMQRFGIGYERITTHAHVDLGGERSDPRSFDWQALQQRLAALGLLCP